MRSLNSLAIQSRDELRAKEYSTSAECWIGETKRFNAMIDHLAFLTASACMMAREGVIACQSQAILEVSTPALLIWNKIIMMPLVGVIDTSRAQHVMEQLLTGISQALAQVTILDVTGVPNIDTVVALPLTKAVSAASMLGTDVIVTGFSCQIAQTLVRLNVNLSHMRTRGTLKAGFAEALRLLKKRVVAAV